MGIIAQREVNSLLRVDGRRTVAGRYSRVEGTCSTTSSFDGIDTFHGTLRLCLHHPGGRLCPLSAGQPAGADVLGAYREDRAVGTGGCRAPVTTSSRSIGTRRSGPDVPERHVVPECHVGGVDR